MTLNKKNSQNYLELLPHGAIKEIHEEIGEAVSYRQVIRVLKGEYSDNHSIIDLAIKKIKSHQKKLNRQNKARKILNLTSHH